MRLARDILALLLVAGLLLATGSRAEADHGFVSSVEGSAGTGDHPANEHPASDHAAGCHALSGTNSSDAPAPHSPRPAPLRYRCCLTGHDVATVLASYVPQPSTQCEGATIPADPALGGRFLDVRNVSTVLFADPPGMTSLRI
jgi:hypothetical protein